MSQTWRLIPLLCADGKTQMAIDLYFLTRHALGHHPPVLRFYTWSPPTLSLGYHQHSYPEAWNHLIWQGQPIDLVRRPTGGRAVLHQGDLTYAVIASGFATNRMESYQQICQFLMQGLSTIGIELHYGTAGRGYIQNPNCFGTATAADLVMSDGSKLIGSAQARKENAILQHGSLRLNPDRALFTTVFGATDLHLPTLSPEQQDIDRVINALTQAAIDCFGIDLIMQPLTVEEQQEIQNITSSV
ncbi:lipoate--protein ligase family protein [Alkalinema pantanalense CENA528]|uniref:lipoate--protein ligase family protein n=1 Tax=Alkalinema pantanalense TaxID=1620705 RepID=UPI003D6FC4F1